MLLRARCCAQGLISSRRRAAPAGAAPPGPQQASPELSQPCRRLLRPPARPTNGPRRCLPSNSHGQCHTNPNQRRLLHVDADGGAGAAGPADQWPRTGSEPARRTIRPAHPLFLTTVSKGRGLSHITRSSPAQGAGRHVAGTWTPAGGALPGVPGWCTHPCTTITRKPARNRKMSRRQQNDCVSLRMWGEATSQACLPVSPPVCVCVPDHYNEQDVLDGHITRQWCQTHTLLQDHQ